MQSNAPGAKASHNIPPDLAGPASRRPLRLGRQRQSDIPCYQARVTNFKARNWACPAASYKVGKPSPYFERKSGSDCQTQALSNLLEFRLIPIMDTHQRAGISHGGLTLTAQNEAKAKVHITTPPTHSPI